MYPFALAVSSRVYVNERLVQLSYYYITRNATDVVSRSSVLYNINLASNTRRVMTRVMRKTDRSPF